MLELSRTILLTTSNGGKSWEPGLSVAGRVRQVRLSAGKTGFIVLEAPLGENAWRRDRMVSTVAAVGVSGGAAPAIHNPPGRMMITDVHLAASGVVYVAGCHVPGTVAHSPIPGSLKVFRTSGGRQWTEIPVDWRATARRAVLAPSGEDLWLATDTGMILKLVRD